VARHPPDTSSNNHHPGHAAILPVKVLLRAKVAEEVTLALVLVRVVHLHRDRIKVVLLVQVGTDQDLAKVLPQVKAEGTHQAKVLLVKVPQAGTVLVLVGSRLVKVLRALVDMHPVKVLLVKARLEGMDQGTDLDLGEGSLREPVRWEYQMGRLLQVALVLHHSKLSLVDSKRTSF